MAERYYEMNQIIIDVLRPFLENMIDNIDTENYGSVYTIVIVSIIALFLIGYFVAWLQGKKKLSKEIEKLGIESKEKRMLLLGKVHESRQEYVINTELIQLSVKLCIDAMQERNLTALAANRTELIDYYFNVLVNIFVKYIEICEIFYEGDRRKITACVLDEVFPFFETTIQFMSVVNNKVILSLLGKDEVKLKRYTLNPVIRFTGSSVFFYQIILRFRYWRLIKNVKQHISA